MHAECSVSWEAVSGRRLVYCSASGLWGRAWIGCVLVVWNPVVPAASASRRLGHRFIVNSLLMKRAAMFSLAVLPCGDGNLTGASNYVIQIRFAVNHCVATCLANG